MTSSTTNTLTDQIQFTESQFLEKRLHLSAKRDRSGSETGEESPFNLSFLEIK